MSGCVPCMKANENIFSLVDYANSLDIKNPKLASKIDQIVLGMVKEAGGDDKPKDPGLDENFKNLSFKQQSILLSNYNKQLEAWLRRQNPTPIEIVNPVPGSVVNTGSETGNPLFSNALTGLELMYKPRAMIKNQGAAMRELFFQLYKKNKLKEAAAIFNGIQKIDPQIYNMLISEMQLNKATPQNVDFLLAIADNKDRSKMLAEIKKYFSANKVPQEVAQFMANKTDELAQYYAQILGSPIGTKIQATKRVKAFTEKYLAGKSAKECYDVINNPTLMDEFIKAKDLLKDPQNTKQSATIIREEFEEVLKKQNKSTKLYDFFAQLAAKFPTLEEHIPLLKKIFGVALNLGFTFYSLYEWIDKLRSGKSTTSELWCSFLSFFLNLIQTLLTYPAVVLATEGGSLGIAGVILAIDFIIQMFCAFKSFGLVSAKNLQGSITQSQLSPNDLSVANQLINIKNKKTINDQFKGMVANNKIENPNEVGAYLRKQLLTKPIAQPGQPVAQPGQPAVA